MFDIALSAPLSLFISLTALTGVTLHDTKLDKLTTSMVGVPAIMARTEGNTKITSDPHTHVERVSLSSLNSTQPRLMPRGDHRKHMLQKAMPKGAHRYDGYALPLAEAFN
jgi:hypothetical protein